jgi:hypothetical protein
MLGEAREPSGRRRLLVIEQYSRQHVVDELNRLGYRELADEASRDLPDPVDVHQISAWGSSMAFPSMT